LIKEDQNRNVIGVEVYNANDQHDNVLKMIAHSRSQALNFRIEESCELKNLGALIL